MADLRSPHERTCRECGRTEIYDESAGKWKIDTEVGSPHCLHVWDITGEFSV